jgi:hypothetical protein
VVKSAGVNSVNTDFVLCSASFQCLFANSAYRNARIVVASCVCRSFARRGDESPMNSTETSTTSRHSPKLRLLHNTTSID